MENREFNAGLQKHLMKCELEYRAKMLPKGSCVDWLGAQCESVEDIARYLKSLGFKIRKIVDEETCCKGEYHRWVVTTSGIVVYVNAGNLFGFVAKAGK